MGGFLDLVGWVGGLRKGFSAVDVNGWEAKGVAQGREDGEMARWGLREAGTPPLSPGGREQLGLRYSNTAFI